MQIAPVDPPHVSQGRNPNISKERLTAPSELSECTGSGCALVVTLNASAQKITAVLIALLSRILAAVHSTIALELRIFTYLEPTAAHYAFVKRMIAALPLPSPQSQRLSFVPFSAPAEYERQLRGSDLLLDSIPFGGSNVVVDALRLGEGCVWGLSGD